MIASISWPQTARSFFPNRILICKICSQIFKLYTCVKEFNWYSPNYISQLVSFHYSYCLYMYRRADKFLARPGRKQANISVKKAWISLGALPCRKKKTWWQLASRCCWNRARLWHASELFFLPGRAKELSAPRYMSDFYHVCCLSHSASSDRYNNVWRRAQMKKNDRKA